MAAIQFGTAAKTYDKIVDSDRNCVETAGGVKYACVINTTDSTVEMWKNVNGTPAKVGTSPTGIWAVSIAIDGANPQIIHAVYTTIGVWPAGNATYCTFNTNTDAWGTPENAATGIDLGSTSAQVLAIAVDAANVPHVAYVGYTNSKRTIYYVNKVGGSWNTPVEVEGGTANIHCDRPSIAIDTTNSGNHRYNVPQIAYVNVDGLTQRAALGGSNNPDASNEFTLVNPATQTNYGFRPSIGVDSNGRTSIAFRYLKLVTVYIDGSAAWGTAENWTAQDVTADNNNDNASQAVIGTDRYVVGIDTNDADIRRGLSSNYGAFSVTDNIEEGTYTAVKLRWQYANNPVTSVDWIFSDGTSVWFDTLALATPPTEKAVGGSLVFH